MALAAFPAALKSDQASRRRNSRANNMRILLFTFVGLLLVPAVQAGSPQIQNQVHQELSNESAKELEEASSLSAAVVKLFAEAKYDDAMPLAKRALEIRERNLNSGDERIAVASINLAEL